MFLRSFRSAVPLLDNQIRSPPRGRRPGGPPECSGRRLGTGGGDRDRSPPPSGGGAPDAACGRSAGGNGVKGRGARPRVPGVERDSRRHSIPHQNPPWTRRAATAALGRGSRSILRRDPNNGRHPTWDHHETANGMKLGKKLLTLSTCGFVGFRIFVVEEPGFRHSRSPRPPPPHRSCRCLCSQAPTRI